MAVPAAPSSRSAAGNLASASPGERRLGIPVTAALVVLSLAVAYGG